MGSETALVEQGSNIDPYHGADGFGNTIHEDESDLHNVQTEHAVNALIRLVKENPSKLRIQCL